MPIPDEKARRRGAEELENERKKEELIPDAVFGRQFRESMMRECPDPAVQAKSKAMVGLCRVSPWTCKTLKCRYAVTYPMHGGVGCSYGDKDERNRGRKEGASSEIEIG